MRLRRFQFKASMASVVCGLAIWSAGAAQGEQQSQRGESRGSARTANKADATSTKMEDSYAEDETPELGMIVDAAPGDSVVVIDTVMGSPAEEAGISHGDYILMLNGEKVKSPSNLCRMVKDLEPNAKVKVMVWRQGSQEEKEVTLASKADELPAGHKAWLGVMLTPSDEGVRIEQVLRGSPASEADLRSGDVILKQGEQEIEDVRSFVQSIEDMGPETELQLTITRNGREQQVGVTLGARDEAPLSFFRQAMGSAMGSDSNRRWNDRGDDTSVEMLEEEVDDLRREIRELKSRMDTSRTREAAPAQRRSGSDGDLSLFDTASATQLVVQRGRGDRDDHGDGWRGRGNNDWRDRDGNDWRRRYRSYYRSPLYSSPRYGNQYYRYGGRPYYYGGYRNYGYGYGRSGLNFGNFGVYWY